MNEGGRVMSQVSSQVSKEVVSRTVLGGFAVCLMFSAVQIASGRDLNSVSQAPASVSQLSAGAGIDRTAKGDRAAGMLASAGQTQTISLRLKGVPDTSVLVSVPATRAARATSVVKPGDRKVACEPVVSVLTEVAKRLEPGRCIT
jgi:hypothetical protein